MKVYVLESDGVGGHQIRGIFSSDEKALEANQILDIAGTITELELDEVKIERWDGGYATKTFEVRKL